MKTMRVLVFGDSIGQGFYDAVNGGWVQQLQRDYFGEDIAGKSEVNIINLSVSGHTSNELLSRINSEVVSRMKEGIGILTVLAVGVNDSYEKAGVRRTSEDKFRENINRIIQIAQPHGEVLVLGCSACVEERVNPTSWDASLTYSNDRLKSYEDILADCADVNGIPFVPLWQETYNAQKDKEIMPDGIHPNDIGHEIIYNEVKKKLKELTI